MLLNFYDMPLPTYKCRKSVMRWLVYKCHLPMWSYDKHYYYFTYTEKLKAYLASMPWYIKVLAVKDNILAFLGLSP